MLFARFGSKWLLMACGALLLLLALAAVTQYRWINRISEADRRQRRELLEATLHGFGGDFDRTLRELIRVYRPTPGLRPGTEVEPYLSRELRTWQTEANHPPLLDAVSFGIEAANGPVFKRRRLGDEQFSRQEWPEALGQYRTILAERLRLPGGEPPLFPRGHAYELVDGRPVIVFPLVEDAHTRDEPDQLPPRPDPRSLLRSLQPSRADRAGRVPELKGWCFLELDLEYVQKRLLPELVARHFGPSGLANYQLAVITGNPPRVIYRSHTTLTAAALSAVDAGMVLFSRHAQGSGLNPGPGRWGEWESGGVGDEEMGRDIFPPSPPRPLAPSPPRPLPGPPPGVGPDRRRRPGFGPPPAPLGPPLERSPEPDDWQLVAKYQDGSLDRAVDQARWRNLALSFGVLLILAGSIAMLLLATQRARRLARQQMEFVAGVSHELRTPLAVIRSTSYNLAQGMIGDAGRVQQYGEVIQHETRRLINQVEQMLSFAGIQSGRQHYDLRPTEVAEIIDRALAEYAADFAASEWQVERRIAADLPLVLADAQALESAIKNLLQNALKYAAQGKHLTVSAHAAPNGKRKEVQLTVADCGPGIDPTDLPHIFDPFYRGKKVWDSSVPGTGLGLSLVERHVQAHGGRITVETSPGQGTAFTLHLPALEPAARGETTDTADELQSPVGGR